MPAGRDNIPANHPRRIALLANSGCDVSREPDDVRRLVAEYRAGGPKPPVLSGAAMIAVKRQRQITAHGYDASNDDAYERGQLICAAMCYASVPLLRLTYKPDAAEAQVIEMMSATWPWDEEFWNPDADAVENLVNAGALIAAEIDRLQRLSVAPAKPDPGAFGERAEPPCHD